MTTLFRLLEDEIEQLQRENEDLQREVERLKAYIRALTERPPISPPARPS